MRLRNIYYGLTLGLLSCLPFYVYAAPSPVVQTQTKLKKLDAQIITLKKTLATAQDKRGVLHNELSSTEKQIGKGVHQLRSIQNNMNSKEQKIAQLQKNLNQLNQQLSTQQQLLAKHVRARYQMGEYQPLKWLVNQNDPYKISRVLTYYQYILKSRQQLIEQIDKTRQHINENKTTLHAELTENKRLTSQLTKHQQQLINHKNYHSTLIHSLNNEIQNKQHSLQEAQRDKDNLSHLLRSLAQQSVLHASESFTQISKPFAQMRRKLPRPIQTTTRSLQKMNQGLTFFADEGTVVTAVYPGKVVFSDWLKGYGLLLIVDHGQGFMTLYAHNQSLFKRKGQSVKQNDHIASVGHSGGIKQDGLYFEVRIKGKAVSPLDWLS